jgi:hypothetical protein
MKSDTNSTSYNASDSISLWSFNDWLKNWNIKNEPELSGVDKIINDSVNILRNPKKSIKINNLLLLSGGGVPSIFFTLGMVNNLVDNGSFYDYDVIGAVSGGSMVLHYIDLCYRYNLVGTKNWYHTYVREPIYNIIDNGVIITILQKHGHEILLNSKLFLSRLNELLLPSIFTQHKHRKSSNSINRKKPILLFNYLNVNTLQIDSNHDDIKNDPNFYIKRFLRCCGTLINFTFANKPTYDAGIVDNIAISKMLYKYNADNITIANIENIHIYEKYRLTNGWSNTLNIFQIILIIANTSNFMNLIDESEELINKNRKICFISNDLHPSNDPIHKGLFKNYNNDNSIISSFYIVYPTPNHIDMIRLFENEGYIQMYFENKQGSKNSKNRKFHIPNKTQYDRKKAKQIYQTFQEQDIINNISNLFTNITDFTTILTNKIGITNTPLCFSDPIVL